MFRRKKSKFEKRRFEEKKENILKQLMWSYFFSKRKTKERFILTSNIYIDSFILSFSKKKMRQYIKNIKPL